MAAPEAYERILWKRTMAGEELGALTMDVARLATRSAASPTRIASCAQDRVEELLRAAAERRGCDLRYATKLVGYAQDADGATVTLRTSAGETALRARYVIAADGASSPSRRLLDVAMEGIPPLATLVGIYFEADLSRWIGDRPGLLYFLMNLTASGIVIGLDGRRRWIYHRLQLEDRLEPEAAAAAVRLAVGVPDLDLTIKSIRPWTMTAEVAERFRVGRIFLAGDAAHRFPPTGGFGLNTGVQDVHNLAWKLARVLAGSAPATLLDSYERERKPVAQSNTDWSVRNFAEGGSAVGPGNLMATMQIESGGPAVPAVLAQLQQDIEGERDHFDALGQDLGFVYEAGALVPDGSALPVVADRAAEYVPNARPGSRAPHCWLRRGAERLSTLDLFGRDFLLLTPDGARGWSAAASTYAGDGIRCARIGANGDWRDEDGTWQRLYGIGPAGAVLVRPDGHVAWRASAGPANDAEGTRRLGDALTAILAGG